MLSRNLQVVGTSNKWIIVGIVGLIIIAILTGVGRLEVESEDTSSGFTISDGDTAWMLASTALIMLMSIPGLALYYGGFANKTSQINTMAMVFVSYSMTSIVWIVYGYALAFGDDTVGGFIGNGRKIFLQGLTPNSISPLASTIPEFIYCTFQLTFAAITVGLVCGGLIERIKFDAFLVFSVLWATFVYLPIAHWVWGGGFLMQWGVLDFAGGTVVHINSGIAALVGTIILGKRLNPHENPRSMSFTMIGTGLLWFGWFGFNAGSATAATGNAATAFINTNTATAVSSIVWISVQRFHTGKPTLAGLCDGSISGLVGITPAAGLVNTMGAVCIGIAVGIIPYGAIILKSKLDLYDDTLNTFGVHCIGGIVGALLTGIYADPGIGYGTGMLFGNPEQLGWQVVGILLVMTYSGVVTAIIMYGLKATMGIRVSMIEEPEGLDKSQHGDVAYFEYEASPQMKKMAASGKVDRNYNDNKPRENSSQDYKEDNSKVPERLDIGNSGI